MVWSSGPVGSDRTYPSPPDYTPPAIWKPAVPSNLQYSGTFSPLSSAHFQRMYILFFLALMAQPASPVRTPLRFVASAAALPVSFLHSFTLRDRTLLRLPFCHGEVYP